MPNTYPTIVSASLSDKELQDSINKMVANFDKGLQTMLEHSNEYVGKIQASLQKIGDTNFGAKGSNDGGIAKQTKAQKEATNETERRLKKEKEVKLTLDQQAEIMGRIPREMRMPDMAKSARESFHAFYKGFNEQARQLESLIKAEDNRLASAGLGRFSSETRAQLAQVDASIDQTRWKINFLYQEEKRLNQEALRQKVSSVGFEQAWLKKDETKSARVREGERLIELEKERQRIIASDPTVQQLDRNIEQTRAKIQQLLTDEKRLHSESLKQAVGSSELERLWNQKYQVRDQRIAEQEKLIQLEKERQNLVAVDPIRTQFANMDELRAKHEKVLNMMREETSSTQQQAQAQRNSANATNQQKQTLDEMNAYLRQNIQREQERRDAIRQTGLAAQDAFAKIRQNTQIQLAENTDKPIKGIKELADAIINMRRLYFDMSTAERESPLGLALKRDIENAQKLKIAIDAYNRTLSGMKVIGTKNNANSSLGAYTELTNILKNLSDEYKRLGREERNAAKGNNLADKIQRISRATQKIQQQMNRPISFAAAMKGDEKTLDDIAYKMQRLRAYKQGIDLTKPNAANEIKQVDEALAKLQKDADKWMSKSQEMIKNNTTLGRSWNYMKNRLAFYFTVGASTQFIKNIIEVRSQYEMNERALGILINSAERGTQIFNELSQMALVSPYTLIELSTAAKQLTAYDVAAKDVVDTTRRLADMAAAVGIPIERLTYALGQIKAYGYLNSRDARMFANAGIPLVKQLSDYYTELEGRLVSTADVYDRIKKKSIDYNEVMEVINKMTDQGGKFFDFQAKMADTLKVRLANLTLAWNNMLNDMGKESQGVLTWGIGALRDLFLQWKQLDKLIKDMALAVGVRTLLVAIRAATIGLTSFGRAATWNAILGKKLGGVVVGLAKSFGTLFSSRLTWFALLAMAAVEATQAIFGVNEAQKALNEAIRNGAKDNYDNISKFIEQYKEVRDSLYSTQKVAIGSIYNPTTRKAEATSYAEQQVGQDIDKNEAKKAWEAVREQIELTVASSDKYIGNLLSISNMSERVRQGFNLLDDIQVVNAALKELDDNTIKITQDYSAWWNAWQAPDGLIGNLKDYQEALDDIIAEYGTLESFRENTFLGGKGSDDLDDYETALERFRDDLQKTTDSVLEFIELKGWSKDESKINQVFEQITQKLVLDNQLDPQKAFTLQTEVEEARSKAAKEALLQRINDEKAAYKISHDESVRQALNADIERYNSWNETNGRSKVEWERFTKWLKEQHISETTAMFRNMDAEDIKSLNFQEGNHAEWVTRMVTQYAKEHKMSYDEAFKYLKSWVKSANQWSVFIPLIISTEDKKSVYDQLGEYDKAVDEADAQIERLTKRIGELNTKKKKSKEETQELANAEQELADAQKAKADAEAKGGHGKKEKKDERATNKAAKQAESELAKALKDELSTIDKVRSIYKDLTKEGMSHANAVERATRGWNETVDAINRVLQKNGLQKLDLSKFAGIENPRELVNMLQSQLNTLLKRGAKPAEIKELQTKIQTLNIDAEKYDLTKITKGLNNELGKLKDEYELAVELDANPEMGNMFTEMFGINTSTFPKTIDEYMQRAQQEFDKMREKRGFGEPLNIFKADDAKWESWGRNMGLVVDVLDENGNVIDKNTDALDKLTPKFKEAQGVAKKWATDVVNNTKKLEYELAELNDKIAIKEKEQALLHEKIEKEENETTKHYLELTYQSNEKSIDELRAQALSLMPEYARVFNSIAEYSAGVSRRLQRDLMRVFDNAKYDSANKRWTLTGSDGKQTILNDTQYRKEREKLTKEMRKSQAPFKKIKEAFKPSDANGVIDYAKGIELVSAEIQKLGSVASEVGNLAQIFGADEQTVEIINDVATSLNGVATAGQGVAQIASGDYIGGAASVLSGITSIIGAWADNSNKRIDAEIKDSELDVKRLENAYKNLEFAIDNAYGANVIGAKQAAIANKELQLVELERQLRLEKSRDSKHRDEERIETLKGEIIDLINEIKTSYQEVATSLLGISSVADAAQGFMDAYIEALRSGEDAMDGFNESVNDMIANLISKFFVTRVIAPQLEKIMDEWNKSLTERSKTEADAYEKAMEEYTRLSNMSDEDIAKEMADKKYLHYGAFRQKGYSEYYESMINGGADVIRAAAEESLKNAEKELKKATTPEKSDVRTLVDALREISPELAEQTQEMLDWLNEFQLMKSDTKDKTLSALQQGISQISESTAESLEAYMNGVSQQVYYHSSLLEQIRDSVVGLDLDVSLGVQSQMLLQLQNSYQTQQAIQQILEGVLVPSGRAFSVELVS